MDNIVLADMFPNNTLHIVSDTFPAMRTSSRTAPNFSEQIFRCDDVGQLFLARQLGHITLSQQFGYAVADFALRAYQIGSDKR